MLPGATGGLIPSKLSRAILAILVLGVSPVLATEEEAGTAVRIELGGGIHLPFGSDERTIYGTGASGTLGFAARISTADVWTHLDVGWLEGRGQESAFDGTFELPDDRYRAIPVTLLMRTNIVPQRHRTDIDTYLGAGLQVVFTRFENAFGETSSEALLGFVFEFRPEVELASRMRLWLRARTSLATPAEFGVGPEFDFSLLAAEIGVSYEAF